MSNGPDDAEPFDPAAVLAAGQAHHQQGRLAEAEQAYVAVLRRLPDHPEALHLLGMLAIQARQPQAAVELITRAIAAEPQVAAMYSNRAVALTALGRDPEAVADYRRAIALQPGFGPVHANLGNALFRLGDYALALEAFDEALALSPATAELHARRGECLHALGRREEAQAAFAQAAELNPGLATAHIGLGAIHAEQGEEALAADSYARAAAADPKAVLAHFNLGNALRLLQRLDEAIASYDRAIALQPQFAVAHHNRAFCLLQKGELQAGFQEYEWRRRCPTFDDPRYALPRPWLGEHLAGKTLFVFHELFQGDMIAFCRYALMAERRGARVLLAAPETMHGLLRSLSPTIDLLPEDAAPEGFDYQAPLMSLPGAFGTTLETLPGEVGYLHAERARVETWRERIGSEGFRIGVVWQGSTAPYALPLQRSYPLAALEGLGRVPTVRLISLQKHNGLDQLATLPPGMTVKTLGEDFDPGPQAFLDTAAAMACCDLVITMDTSAAHLAGALGLRTWLALPLIADWRWLTDRADSPWYPSLRIFRQTVRGDWTGVFAAMEAALRAELKPSG